MSISPSLRTALIIATSLVGLAAVGWFAKQSDWLAEKSPIESNNTVDLDGLTYTVEGVFHASSIGFVTAHSGTSYLVVDIRVVNKKPVTVTHNAEFWIIDSRGTSYDLDDDATMNTRNGFFGTFNVRPKFEGVITLAFTVPKKSLSRTWTLAIQNNNDKTSPGMIKVGSPTKDLPQVGLVTIKDSEAVNHIGEKVVVRGVVSEVFTNRNGTFICLGGGPPNELFMGGVPAAAALSGDSFLKSLEGKELSIIGMLRLDQATPLIVIRAKSQIEVEWKTAEEDPIDYLNGVVNDKYRKKLGLTQPISKTELREFKTYLDYNVENWKDKDDDDDIWRLFPRVLQRKRNIE